MTASIDRSALTHLTRAFRGTILGPHDAGYDDARSIFNAMIDVKPRVIAQCTDVNDVIGAIGFARTSGLDVAVRGGGHGVTGTALSEGGLVIDLRGMNGVSVDPAQRTVTVGGGATMRDLDRATEPYGLATTGGRVSSTGIGGLALGGGTGWLDRKFGLVSDNLLSVEIVTAGGEILRASDSENTDLFWGLHGGGGNFGVATSFTFRLHELRSVTAALLFWHPDRAPEVLKSYRDFMQSAPDEVGGGAFFVTGPDESFTPPQLVGQLALLVLVVYAGEESVARTVAAPLLALGHASAAVTEMSYANLQCMLDDPPGYRNYWTSEHLTTFPDAAVDRFCVRATDMIVPSPSQQVLFPQGGAASRVKADHPIPWRHAPWCVHPFGLWTDPADDDRARQWARSVRQAVEPWASGDVYLNFIGNEGDRRLMAGYGPGNYPRLAALKARYDPQNVFRSNHNILPSR